MAPLYSVPEIENVRSWVPRQDVTDVFDERVQQRLTVRAGYKNNETGRVNAIWPGSSLHYLQVIKQFRYEDFEFHYADKNPCAHLGMGWTVEDRLGPKQADVSPYEANREKQRKALREKARV
ncbi:hypothetical protein C8A03DRAFT_36971 [Achaetomium macrosporum]|uniref:Uncharacterized protein n=1 Tax=Achaetomium macrosporum TaxID=79813 RepID=A0AAN7H4Y2_9PEZI|nr:hypothetical protein C8A03DRAFT_36971 [Achaetomium macrosporum]